MNCIEQMISDGTFSIPTIQRKLKVSSDKARELLEQYGISLEQVPQSKVLDKWQKRRQKRILKNKMNQLLKWKIENPDECLRCKMWDMAAVENGYRCGMFEECFNSSYVNVNMADELNRLENEK